MMLITQGRVLNFLRTLMMKLWSMESNAFAVSRKKM